MSDILVKLFPGGSKWYSSSSTPPIQDASKLKSHNVGVEAAGGYEGVARSESGSCRGSVVLRCIRAYGEERKSRVSGSENVAGGVRRVGAGSDGSDEVSSIAEMALRRRWRVAGCRLRHREKRGEMRSMSMSILPQSLPYIGVLGVLWAWRDSDDGADRARRSYVYTKCCLGSWNSGAGVV
ncbi:hypothetical protein R3P38DRAFT_2776706 [Favolaschia claudopus]|uniref:Uncharacterized protein n=1 Tax=Favolaschia claudopus TaxID=2862362 RepID=A0AAW0BNB5_9AGAR